MAFDQIIILGATLLDLVDPACRSELERRDRNSILYKSSLVTQRTQIHSLPLLGVWPCPRFILYHIWHTGIVVTLWQCGIVIYTLEVVLERTCIMQRESVADSLSICKSYILWLNRTLENLSIRAVFWFRADLLSKIVLYW